MCRLRSLPLGRSLRKRLAGDDSLFNVANAFSRAKGLALIFGSSRLRGEKCNTVQKMQPVNALRVLKGLE